jgi:type I restriction enzyme M protein
MAKRTNTASFEQQLFKAADKLRKNIDAAEYKYVVLGLVFIKYISESFNELYQKLEADEWSDPEDRDEYLAENVFFVPQIARWSHIHNNAKLPSIGQTIDEAMEAIESENKELKNVLPKVYGKANLDKASLGQLIDLISNTELQAENEKSKDLFGRVYEYFLGEFANAEGKKGGQFYTPKAIVKLMVEMIEPYKGRVYDPACGSGGMFVMSEKFVTEHQGNISDITVYGQESNQTTWKLSKMNLAIRNINSQFVTWNTEGSFLKEAHPDLKADYILANPPFNQKDWGIDILQDDARWKFGAPPSGNANFGWMQHMLYHLAPKGIMATVLANGSLSSNTSGEGVIRKHLVEADLVECIVALPKQLFYNTGIPACIWFLRRGRTVNNNKVLFIDASEMGYMKDRTHRDLDEEDITKICDTYHNWRNVIASEAKQSVYEDIKGFCKSATLEDIQKHNHVLTPGRYVGIPDEEDDGIPFEDKMADLKATLKEQMDREEALNEEIKEQLSKIGLSL